MSRFKGPNPIEQQGDTIRIFLTQGLTAILDAEDYPKVQPYRWCAQKFAKGTIVYATSTVKGKSLRMHRLIVEPSNGYTVDHIDGQGLNNTRDNLRECLQSDNLKNQRTHKRGKQSQFKGVRKTPGFNRWAASLCGKHLGCFPTQEAAALAYDKAARQYFGEFARPNFPDPTEVQPAA